MGFLYGPKVESAHCHHCPGHSWAVCWLIPESSGEGAGLVSSEAGGRVQQPVAHPKGKGLNQSWLVLVAKGPVAGVLSWEGH